MPYLVGTLLLLLLGVIAPAEAIPVSVAPLVCPVGPPVCGSEGASCGDVTTASGSFELQFPSLPPALGALVSVLITYEGTAAGGIHTDVNPGAFSLSVAFRLETQQGDLIDEFSRGLGQGECSASPNGGFLCTDGDDILRTRAFSGDALALLLQPLVLRYEWQAGAPAGSELVATRLLGLDLGPLRYDYVPVPEAGSLLLCAAGMALLGAARRRLA